MVYLVFIALPGARFSQGQLDMSKMLCDVVIEYSGDIVVI